MQDTEINELVARKLGWVYIEKDASWFHAQSFDIEKTVHPGGGYRDYMANVKPEREVETLPDYGHSIEAAWEIPTKHPVITEQIAKSGLYPPDSRFEFAIDWSDGQWTAGWKVYDYYVIDGTHAEIAMAICLAFLKLEEINETSRTVRHT